MKTVERFTKSQLVAEIQRVQQNTEAIFNLISPDAYYEKPIPLRHPIVFYEGHLPAFTWNILFRRILDLPAFNPELDILFARGIDPADASTADVLNQKTWPDRDTVKQYKQEIYKRLLEYLNTENIFDNPHPLLKDGYILYLLLEHDLMHQETLLYIFHQLPHALKNRPHDVPVYQPQLAPTPVMKQVPEGTALLGAKPNEFEFAWDNELPAFEVEVPAFSMDAYNITNGQFLEFIENGGYQTRALWDDETWAWREQQTITHPFFWNNQDNAWFLKDFFEDIPLPLEWPVYVTHAEAQAYARSVGKSLPTEAQWHRAAYGNQQNQRFPWGDSLANKPYGNFNFSEYSPVKVGSFKEENSPYGIYDLAGNGWEWTSTPFMPFEGFQASEGYPQYSADFFDGHHYVIKGASQFTAERLLRRSFRNWFYWHYPYMYATFRCVSQ